MARGVLDRLVRDLEAPVAARGFWTGWFAIDRIFGTYYMPGKAWPSGYGVPESVPRGHRAQFADPFRGLWGARGID